MTIKLQVVGIFYSVELEASDVHHDSVHPGSVEAVLDAAVKHPGSGKHFTYTYVTFAHSSKKIVNSFSATYSQEFTTPVLHQKYPPGTYYLAQNLDASQAAYTVWQYYVLNENGQRVPLPHPAASYTTDLGIRDGYTVIWRLVSILNPKKHKDISPRQARLLGV